jgi:hypothetical protein
VKKKSDEKKKKSQKEPKVQMPEMKYDNGEIRVCVLGCKMPE